MRIQTTRNVVITEQPEPDDVLVRVSLMVPGDEPGTRSVRHLPYQPVSEYQEAVDWAVGMADSMAYPIHVVPLSHNDIFRTKRWDPFREFIAGMNDQERGELRHMIVTTAAEVMRDSDDPEIRADMFHVLRQLKVIRHES
ncbi:MAG: hypothetical protein B7X90_14640 [Novosphingobium sp. 17-62-19]|uniref:hypothetical protein n=1 Tax=Novosphingobium sp. 17-62-19 TaxID=1970406 RepID=UPI000BCB51F5|nr:hypothetical protein [Novosphingobium sp. 17-62-19]OZA17534.1 MAG: hypothetical protein B7X90_14640 [Novosphingobium sp. 17-62-19]HQS96827.1 hypothetical protein [Novosphingobium sp.]